MRLRLTPEVRNSLKRLKKNDPKTFELAKKQLVIFENNPKHPSLRIHKLSGKLNNVWSISIGRKLRLIYFIKDGDAWAYLIGTHDQVYRK